MNSLYSKIKQEKLIVAIALTVWLFLVLTTISKSYAYFIRNNEVPDLNFLVVRALFIWGVIALFTPVWIKLARKLFQHDSTVLTFGIHIIMSILIVPVYSVTYRLLMLVLWYDNSWNLESMMASIPTVMVSYGIVGPLSYWLTIGSYYLKKYYDQYKERQLRNMEMQAELASIRLHVLKVQLHPHFLFNTLHNINSLIYEAPEIARRLLNLLKRFLQISIKRVNKQLVPLMDELEFTGTYLAIEKTRFSDRLTINTDIEEDTINALVPSFLLQPLVENAVKHGISKKMQPGILRITSKKSGEYLNLSVEDNGPGINGTSNGSGIGLENIRQRLNQLFTENSFELLRSELGGLKVEIRIPFTTKKQTAVANHG
ncbi:hypothetical protein G3570_10420 [Balneolaceae bacterium YR4-1]|uniref:Histidine kinase domain-containing protein n=1 Tax=Halalkalibaculum roseum TaxID=2709311 RepID=A0A6M1SXQ3_9BACT|nr:histidine kinase [Halalkalibaculum roseum]NGP77048.1 hypothetical protein [Halalkalibaculum roseum]